jgi:CheY-like chemotaxis protein
MDPSLNILVIDDEPLIQDFFAKLARIRGWQGIDTASTGEEALTRVLRQAYDLITVDLEMPGISGLEVVAMLRNMNPRAVICIISGHLPTHISNDVATCIDLALSKPLDNDVFNRLLDAAADLRRSLDRVHAINTE